MFPGNPAGWDAGLSLPACPKGPTEPALDRGAECASLVRIVEELCQFPFDGVLDDLPQLINSQSSQDSHLLRSSMFGLVRG